MQSQRVRTRRRSMSLAHSACSWHWTGGGPSGRPVAKVAPQRNRCAGDRIIRQEVPGPGRTCNSRKRALLRALRWRRASAQGAVHGRSGTRPTAGSTGINMFTPPEVRRVEGLWWLTTSACDDMLRRCRRRVAALGEDIWTSLKAETLVCFAALHVGGPGRMCSFRHA